MDTSSHVITHIQAFHADKVDSQCFPEVLENIIENLKGNNLDVKEVLADAGYSSVPVLQALVDHRIEGYIPNPSGYKTGREGFTYDRDNDRYTCSQGKHLVFKYVRMKGEHPHKVYKTGVRDCKNCPSRNTRANPAGVKSLEDSMGKDLYDQMYRRMQTGRGRKMKRLRSSTVEPVLGTLVNYTAMKQVNTKGMALANKCLIMAAVAYNLKKLVKRCVAKPRKRVSTTNRQALSPPNRQWSPGTYTSTEHSDTKPQQVWKMAG